MLARLPDHVIARSASDRTDNWPFWYVAASRDSLNITGQIARDLGYNFRPGAVLTSRDDAMLLAEQWNALCEAQ